MMGMKRRLSIGTVAKMIGMSSESLRNYSRKKIIEPYCVEDNGYRYYTRDSMTKLFRARFIKSMGYSLPEVFDSNSTGLPIDKWTDSLQARGQKIQQEIDRLQITMQKVESHRQRVMRIGDLYGEYVIEQSGEMLYMDFSNELEEMYDSPEMIAQIRKWVEHFPAVQTAFRVRQKILTDQIQNGDRLIHSCYRRGFILPIGEAVRFGLTQDLMTDILPSKPCIHTVIMWNSQATGTLKTMESAIEYMRNNNLVADGDAYGTWLARVQRESDVARYFELWIPIKVR
jgi:DNA-binding transcriptional MerR regulator